VCDIPSWRQNSNHLRLELTFVLQWCVTSTVVVTFHPDDKTPTICGSNSLFFYSGVWHPILTTKIRPSAARTHFCSTVVCDIYGGGDIPSWRQNSNHLRLELTFFLRWCVTSNPDDKTPTICGSNSLLFYGGVWHPILTTKIRPSAARTHFFRHPILTRKLWP